MRVPEQAGLGVQVLRISLSLRLQPPASSCQTRSPGRAATSTPQPPPQPPPLAHNPPLNDEHGTPKPRVGLARGGLSRSQSRCGRGTQVPEHVEAQVSLRPKGCSSVLGDTEQGHTPGLLSLGLVLYQLHHGLHRPRRAALHAEGRQPDGAGG